MVLLLIWWKESSNRDLSHQVICPPVFHFTDEDSKAQRGEVIWPKSPRGQGHAERWHMGKKLRCQDSQAGSNHQLLAGVGRWGAWASELTHRSTRFFLCKMGVRVIILRAVVRIELGNKWLERALHIQEHRRR